jgi:release factor glutamine methyltransferase
MPRLQLRTLLQQFFHKYGRQSARSELRWMNWHKVRHESPTRAGEMLLRRLQDEPLAYVLGIVLVYDLQRCINLSREGSQPFGDLDILVRPPILIPRHETEDWTLRLAERVRDTQIESHGPLKLLDICTGTGCIPLLLLSRLRALLPTRRITAHAVDISVEAISLAELNKENQLTSGALGAGHYLNFHHHDLFSSDFADFLSGHGPFDVITCNPPYISPAEYSALPPSVIKFEDRDALLGTGEDGTGYYRQLSLLLSTGTLIRSNGLLAMEIGWKQAPVVPSLFSSLSRLVEIWKDPWGKDRLVVCTL